MMDLRQKLKSKSVVNEVTGCWEFQHACASGYGSVWTRRGTMSAHKASYTAFVGEVPEGLCVMHSCDNTGCINPEHLELGTPKDNSEDMVFRGRSAVGERNGHAVLSVEQIEEIRAKWRIGGVTQTSLARQYGVSISTVHLIVRHKTWRHLHDDERKRPEAPGPSGTD